MGSFIRKTKLVRDLFLIFLGSKKLTDPTLTYVYKNVRRAYFNGERNSHENP